MKKLTERHEEVNRETRRSLQRDTKKFTERHEEVYRET